MMFFNKRALFTKSKYYNSAVKPESLNAAKFISSTNVGELEQIEEKERKMLTKL